MKIVKRPETMQGITMGLKRKGGTIGFVPTMGALHEGHLSLIRRARRENDIVIVSIFVNPLQFGPSEDLKRYPRPFGKDKKLCLQEGVDFLFYPDAGALYPRDFRTQISVKGLEDVLCGKSRPGHFRGVSTVVAKLFNIVQPDNAYFGQKDSQQAVIIRRMVKDLNMPLEIVVMPIIREKDGLAMSSRNAYLENKERETAPVVYRALQGAGTLVAKGIRDSGKIAAAIKNILISQKSGPVPVIDYVAVVDLESLLPVRTISRDARTLIALAARIGKTRLIDNVIIGRRKKGKW